MLPTIDIKTAESVAKSMIFLGLSVTTGFVAMIATILGLGWAADHYHNYPAMSVVLVVYTGWVAMAANMLGIHFFHKSEAVL